MIMFKGYKNNISLILMVCIGMTISCATPRQPAEPTATMDTLLIGRVCMVCTKGSRTLAAGTYTMGLEISFDDPVNRKTHVLESSGPDGLFYLVNPEASKYMITKIFFRSPYGHTRWAYPHNRNVYTIIPGKVNNIGLIEWRMSAEEAFQLYYVDQKYDETKKLFAAQYPESLWNTRPWIRLQAETESKSEFPEHAR